MPVNKFYALSLVLDSSFIATVLFTNGPNAANETTFILSAGATAIDLGLITVQDDGGFPEFEPAEQNDQDDDGIDDYDDDDDEEEEEEEDDDDDDESEGEE